MDLRSQKNIAARIMKCGKTRVWLDPSRANDISEAITAADIRRLIKDGVIKALPKRGISSYRKKKMAKQKLRGRRKGKGSRKGKIGTRVMKKKTWIKRIRALRKLLKELRASGRIEKKDYRNIYLKTKSGFFRSRSHLMGYLESNEIIKEDKNVQEKKK